MKIARSEKCEGEVKKIYLILPSGPFLFPYGVRTMVGRLRKGKRGESSTKIEGNVVIRIVKLVRKVTIEKILGLV